MNADAVIESYVADVAAQLPARLRHDVAAELRVLLGEELRARAPHGADDGEALALVRAFGKPSEVAARYHTPYVLIEPADTRAFFLAALAGALLIPSTNRHLPISVDGGTALFLLLAWLGALVVIFAGRNWARRRWPDLFAWRPSALRDRHAGGAVAQIGWAIFYGLVIAVYLAPGAALGPLTGDRIDLTYTGDFRQPLRLLGFPVLLGVLIVLRLAVAARGRWMPVLRILDICFLVSAGLQLGWHASYGSIFRVAEVDRGGRLVFQLVGGAMVIAAAFRMYRELTRIPLPRTQRTAGFSEQG